MSPKMVRRSVAVAAFAAVVAVPGIAEVRPVGGEFRVNLDTRSNRQHPVAAYAPSGASVVIWENANLGLRGVVYDRNGAPATPELALVPNQGLGRIPAAGEVVDRKDPAVVALPSGEFVVAWTEERAFLRVDYFIQNRQVLDQDIKLQRFSASGAAVGQSVRVNTTAGAFESLPQLALRKNGDLVVVWRSDRGLFGRVVSATGRPSGAEFKVNVDAGVSFSRPAVAASTDGSFLVSWEGCCDGSAVGIFARAYDAAGSPVGGEVRVNTTTASWQRRPSVAVGAGGDYLVVWQSQVVPGHLRVDGQFVGRAGNLVGPQLGIARDEGGAKFAPVVTAMPGGRFFVAWLTWKNLNSLMVQGVELDALAQAVGDELWISQRKLQHNPRIGIAASAAGDVLVPWGAADPKVGIAARRLGAE